MLYILCLDRLCVWERRNWPSPWMNRLRSSLLSVTLLLTSSCKGGKKVDSQASPERCSTAWASLSLCADLCFLLCGSPSPLAFYPLPFSISPSLFSPSLSWSFIPSLSTPPPHLSLSLSSECLCNSYSYLLVGARIRASLLMCSCSPRGKRRQRKHFKKLKLHAGKQDRKKGRRKHFGLELHATWRTRKRRELMGAD